MQNLWLYFILIKCTESKPPLRIIGGRDAANDEFPYVVRLQMLLPVTKEDNSTIVRVIPLCTGSVLTPVWTVSAAHCFDSDIEKTSKHTLYIAPGTINATVTDASAFSRIDYYIKHPAFQILGIRNGVYLANDVAIVRHQSVVLKHYSKVAGLDFTSIIGHEVILAGYGLTNNSEGELFDTLELGKPLQVLTGAVVHCLPDRVMYPALCIARQCGQVIGNSCSGDSGGPAVHPAGIVGIISKALMCQAALRVKSVRPMVFITPLSPYLEWISDHITKSN